MIAADYGGRWDIAQAARRLAEEAVDGKRTVESIGEEAVEGHMQLADLPPVDLLIRSSGEQRISNFILWQAAYSEFFLPIYCGLILTRLPWMRQSQRLNSVTDALVGEL